MFAVFRLGNLLNGLNNDILTRTSATSPASYFLFTSFALLFRTCVRRDDDMRRHSRFVDIRGAFPPPRGCSASHCSQTVQTVRFPTWPKNSDRNLAKILSYASGQLFIQRKATMLRFKSNLKIIGYHVTNG